MNLDLIHAIEKMGKVKIRIEGENLYVDNSLDLEGCIGLTELPGNLHVDSWLDLSGCTGLTKLSENLYVKLSLYLDGCTGLTKFPENLHVSGSLYLHDCTNLKSDEHYLISEEIDSCLNKAIYNISTGIVKCERFAGTLDEFEERVHEVHPSGGYSEQYDKYIDLCRNCQINNN